jgi:hypothetical protein
MWITGSHFFFRGEGEGIEFARYLKNILAEFFTKHKEHARCEENARRVWEEVRKTNEKQLDMLAVRHANAESPRLRQWLILNVWSFRHGLSFLAPHFSLFFERPEVSQWSFLFLQLIFFSCEACVASVSHSGSRWTHSARNILNTAIFWQIQSETIFLNILDGMLFWTRSLTPMLDLRMPTFAGSYKLRYAWGDSTNSRQIHAYCTRSSSLRPSSSSHDKVYTFPEIPSFASLFPSSFLFS